MKTLLHLCMAFVLLALAGGCGENRADEDHGARIVYGSRDYDQINPLLNEYGVIDQLLFDGVMRRGRRCRDWRSRTNTIRRPIPMYFGCVTACSGMTGNRCVRRM